MNIFSTALSIDWMQQTTQGAGCVDDGDYLSWWEMEWNLHGEAKIETVDSKELCRASPSVNLFFAGFSGMESCMYFCQNLGTRAPPVVTLQQWTDYENVLKQIHDFSKRRKGVNGIWLALEDKDIEGEWKDFYNGQPANFTLPWLQGEPNGGNHENCLNLLSGTSLWNDDGCQRKEIACSCERKTQLYLKLRGLCPHSTVRDRYFQPMNNFTDSTELNLVGMYYTKIRYDHGQKVWTLTDAEYNVTGSSTAPQASYTIGKHNWTIRGDVGCFRNGEEYTIELKMSGCREKQFTCNDGQCVSINQRCDQLTDCRDESDEHHCNILILKDGYNKNVVPVRSNHGEKEMVNVSISIDLLKLVDIKEKDYSIKIQFAITLDWMENRATYQNLKLDKSLNALTQNDIERLWLPRVIYENTDQKETTRLGEFGNGEWETRVVVNRRGNFTMGELDNINEIEIFNGAENNLIMSQTYTHEFQCEYDFSMYPFDTQVLGMLPPPHKKKNGKMWEF